MKKKFLLLMTMVCVFGVFATVFAVSRTDAENVAKCLMQNAQTPASENTDLSKIPVLGQCFSSENADSATQLPDGESQLQNNL